MAGTKNHPITYSSKARHVHPQDFNEATKWIESIGDNSIAVNRDIDLDSHQLANLSVPDANGEAIRQTTKITEANLEVAYDHSQVVTENPHAIDLTDLSTYDHKDLQNLQGGTANEYYHATAAEYAELVQFLDSISVGSGGLVTFSNDILMAGSGKHLFRDSDIGIYSQADTFLDLFADGAVRIGDSSAGAPTNYTNFAPDGLQTMIGTARVLKQEWIQAEAIRAPGTNPASFEDVGISGAWQFADNLEKVVICKLPLITDIDTSEDADIYLGWSTPTTSEVCRWQVEYLIRTSDEDMSAVAEVTLTQDETSSSTANGLVISSFTISAANINDSDHCLLLRITRLGNHANDTLGDVANLHGICLHYTSNKLGTAIT